MLANKQNENFCFSMSTENRRFECIGVVDCGNFEKGFVLFYFSSSSICLMAVDFSKWKKKECEV